ncbi:unnamed protein product [Moneuplotes crassus]|uniref:Uncharacterized protein n=1 Tax=Euplotes crassus TaxID=5936 RepID=A0AAD1XXF4_EUPCR|nr:unnamed protein product [Moneuplotes crassus]
MSRPQVRIQYRSRDEISMDLTPAKLPQINSTNREDLRNSLKLSSQLGMFAPSSPKNPRYLQRKSKMLVQMPDMRYKHRKEYQNSTFENHNESSNVFNISSFKIDTSYKKDITSLLEECTLTVSSKILDSLQDYSLKQPSLPQKEMNRQKKVIKNNSVRKKQTNRISANKSTLSSSPTKFSLIGLQMKQTPKSTYKKDPTQSPPSKDPISSPQSPLLPDHPSLSSLPHPQSPTSLFTSPPTLAPSPLQNPLLVAGQKRSEILEILSGTDATLRQDIDSGIEEIKKDGKEDALGAIEEGRTDSLLFEDQSNVIEPTEITETSNPQEFIFQTNKNNSKDLAGNKTSKRAIVISKVPMARIRNGKSGLKRSSDSVSNYSNDSYESESIRSRDPEMKVSIYKKSPKNPSKTQRKLVSISQTYKNSKIPTQDFTDIKFTPRNSHFGSKKRSLDIHSLPHQTRLENTKALRYNLSSKVYPLKKIKLKNERKMLQKGAVRFPVIQKEIPPNFERQNKVIVKAKVPELGKSSLMPSSNPIISPRVSNITVFNNVIDPQFRSIEQYNKLNVNKRKIMTQIYYD